MKKFLPIFLVPFLTLSIFSSVSSEWNWRRYRPTITWSPPRVEEEQFPGTAKILTATFTSKKDLENVKFWLTPPLRRYATVEPESIDKVEKNKEYTVQVIISLPTDVLLKTYSAKHLDNDIKGLDKELKDHLGKYKDLKEYLRKFLKKRIPGLLFVTSEKTLPRCKFWCKGRKRKIRVVHPKALRIMVKLKEPTAEKIPIDEASFPTLEKIYEDPGTGAVYIKDEILIGFKESTSETRIKEIVNEINGVFLGSIPDLGLYQVRVLVTEPSELDVIIQHLKSYTEIKLVTYHWIDYWDKEPNDEKFDSWNEGQPADNNWDRELVKLPSAWEFTTGVKEVIVGIVDNGFDIKHEDLEPNISPLSSVKLVESHGTHVVGIVGAKGTPEEEPMGKGIAGVMWDSTLFLHSVDFPISDVLHNILPSVLGMKHAVDNGAKVINYSAGAKGLTDLTKVEEINELWRILIYWANRKRDDILFVFSAGNDSYDHKYHSPSILSEEYDNIVSVAAIQFDRNLANFSNYGESVSVAAPGVDIFSTLPFNSYGIKSGTSVAAPFVSGLAGLIFSKAKEMGITLTAKDVKDLTVNGAIKGGKYVYGPDAYPIFIINAYESLKLLAAPPALPWITCSACPEPPEVSIVGNRICMGIADKNEGDTQGISIHGASALLPQSEKYQITFEFDLHTWDSYNALGTPNPPYYGGTGYWDSFSISISQNPYWTLDLTDPITEINLPGLGFLWGGTSYGDGFIESNSGIQTIEIVGSPDIPNYLNVVLDTATLPESNHVYPSWGCIEVTVIPK